MINARAPYFSGEFPFMSAEALYGRSRSLGTSNRGTLFVTKRRIFFERKSRLVSAMTMTPVSLKIEEVASMSTERDGPPDDAADKKQGKLVILTSNNQKFEFRFTKSDPDSWVRKISELKTETLPALPIDAPPETAQKFEVLDAFRNALIESQIAVKCRMISTDLRTIKEVDDKVEEAWARFSEASDYLDAQDYETMEETCLHQKKVIALWAYGVRPDPAKDLNQLDRCFNTAYDRLGEILSILSPV